MTGWALLLVLAPMLASCSRATPVCDYADGLVTASELAGATDAYAAAQEAGEDDCAEDGLSRVGELRASASTYVAKGRVAARAGKTAAAAESFEAALVVDRSDDAAAAELQRLIPASPTPAPAVSTVLIATPTAGGSGVGLPGLAIALAVLAVLGCAGVWRFCRRQIGEAAASARETGEAAAIARQEAVREFGEARGELTGLRDDLTQLHTRLVGEIARLDGRVAEAAERDADAKQAAEALRDDIAQFVGASLRALRDDAAPRIEETYLPRSEERP